MILSKLLLNPRSRQVQAELSNPYEMHRTIMSGFPDGIKQQGRVLYRLEVRQQPPYLSVLVQSQLQPDWQPVWESGYLLQPAESKPFQLRVETGQVFAFRLVANPTRKLKDADNENGKRVGIYKVEEQEAWFKRKAGQHGFSLRALQIKPGDRFEGKLVNGKRKHTLKLVMVQFDGLLEVTDVPEFEAAIAAGIGSAKGFGFGLLSIARVN